MIVDEFRDSIGIYDEMLRSGERDPLSMLNIVDKRLADISNHIAVCHRVLAEQRSLAHGAFLGSTRKRHVDKAEQAGQVLEQVIAVQSDLFDFRHKVLSQVATHLRGVV
ncbi:hypothetical protein ACCQ13_00195 [Xanthomonas sp. NCPPB 1638]|uniref:hypothetical protein n=1 Tax=Xanthomonas TaxID=338 RepID=UPI00132EC636|nr:hypothetical protein [Xanthomonas cucurbitae]QHG85651.1 hypothetical protein EBN15_00210 [Xanthomonas cucurbitae]WDM75526.1 hypothetical protein K6982_00185 [Xanthomonas cucurbitae]